MSNLGKRLQQARKAAGLSLRTLGECVGMSHMAIKKFEDGVLYPSSDVLLKLAKVVHVRVDYFLRPIKGSLGEVKFRKRRRLSKKGEEAIRFEVMNQIERRLELENLYPVDVSFERISGEIESLEDVERIAEALREQWKLGMVPISDLIDVFESHGIKVFIVDCEEEDFDGLSTQIENQPVIVISSRWSGDRQRFNLAHELGHELLKLPKHLNEEQACNRFAGAFLFPREAVFQQFGKKRHRIEWRELQLLKEQYQLSMGAICYRIKDLGIISEGYFKKLMIQFRMKGWHRKEPGIEIPPEKAHLFQQMVFHALGEKYFGESKAAELLSCSLDKLKALRLCFSSSVMQTS